MSGMLKAIVIGAGINGVTAAIELKQRGHRVLLIDPGPLPHPLAASTDISKAIRAAYGPDEDYSTLAERAIPLWRKWNEEFGVQLYHETGVMFVRRQEMQPGDFEYESFKVLQRRGAKVERMNVAQLRERFRASGQPVFHLKPRQPELFEPERFPVFGADISTTGYYGFPLSPEGVVKIANHGPGREMSPESSNRVVTPQGEQNLREFLSSTFPALADAPIVNTRICLYCDTSDGHFWIAPDPERPGLIVATGDSGHGFKFAPVLGEIIADAAEGKSNPLLEKFRWRPEIRAGQQKEAARFN